MWPHTAAAASQLDAGSRWRDCAAARHVTGSRDPLRADAAADVEEAVRAGRIHYEAGMLHAEPGFSPASLDELERRGYRVVRWKGLNLYFGGVQAVARNPATGELSGGGDPRRGGAATVVDA